MVDLLYKVNKSSQDIEELLSEHKKLVYHMLTTMCLLNNQDAESAAWEGLWDAIVTFDIFSETKFSTYACKVIKNAILNQLRKDTAKKRIQYITVDFDALNNHYTLANFDCNETINAIYKIFSEYVSTKTGVTKNVLLAWYSLDFDTNVSNLAKMCDCSTSYVSRVQSAFRAYVDTQLGGK